MFGVSIVQQEEIGVDEVSNAVANGDSVETITSLYEQVVALGDDADAKAALISSSTAELSDELKTLKSTLSSSISVSDPIKSNLNLAINAVLADADYNHSLLYKHL